MPSEEITIGVCLFGWFDEVPPEPPAGAGQDVISGGVMAVKMRPERPGTQPRNRDEQDEAGSIESMEGHTIIGTQENACE